MSLVFRNKHGRFVGSGYKGIAYYVDAAGESKSIRGLSLGKYQQLRREYKLPPIAKPLVTKVPPSQQLDILRAAAKADRVNYRDTKGRIVSAGYPGNVVIRYYRNGKLIDQFTIRGLSADKKLLYKPRYAVPKGKVIYLEFDHDDGFTLLEALQNSGVYFGHLKRARVVIKAGGETITFYIDFSKKEKHWDKRYYFAYRTRNIMMYRRLRFSKKGLVKGRAAKRLKGIRLVRIWITPL